MHRSNRSIHALIAHVSYLTSQISSLPLTPLLVAIGSSALLSISSLLIVLIRVSPITSPGYAIPAFFLSLILAMTTTGTLLFFGLWRVLPLHSWDTGKTLGVSVREGIFLGISTALLALFLMLGLLTWWIAIMICSVFVLLELALHY